MEHWLQAIVKRKLTLERLRVPLETNLTLLAAVMLWSESMHKVSASLGKMRACSRIWAAGVLGALAHPTGSQSVGIRDTACAATRRHAQATSLVRPDVTRKHAR